MPTPRTTGGAPPKSRGRAARRARFRPLAGPAPPGTDELLVSGPLGAAAPVRLAEQLTLQIQRMLGEKMTKFLKQQVAISSIN